MVLSVNTNRGASIALRNLNQTNGLLQTTQMKITTGLKVSGPKDDASTYAIAQNMRGDIAGMKAVETALANGEATVATATTAAQSISELLLEMKAKVIQANQAGLDSASRTALHNDLAALRSQVDKIADSAEFNGTNLIKSGTSAVSSNSGINVTASSSSWVNTGISVSAGDVLDFSAPGTVNITGSVTADADGDITPEDYGTFATNATAPELPAYSLIGWIGSGAPDPDEAFFVGSSSSEIATTSGTLYLAFNDDVFGDNSGSFSVTANVNDVDDFKVLSTTGGDVIDISGHRLTSSSLGLDTIDLTTERSANRAVVEIDKAINSVSDALASLGSAAQRLEIQKDYNSQLSDILTDGVGELVDADLAAASAELQSLQIKQQLGVQALSIANSSPQLIVSLFG